MEDSKNLVLFIILSVGVLLGWGMLFPPSKQNLPPTVRRGPSGKRAQDRPKTPAGHKAQTGPTTQAATQPSTQPSTLAAKPGTARPAPRRVVVPKLPRQTKSFASKLVVTQVSNITGAVVGMKLKKFWEPGAKPGTKTKARYNLVSQTLKSHPPLTELLLAPEFKVEAGRRQIVYTSITQPKPNVVVLQARVSSNKGGHLALEKRYTFDPNTYRFAVTYRLTNHTGHPVSTQMALSLRDHEDPAKLSQGGMFSQPEQLMVLCHNPKESTPQRFDSKDLAKSEGKVTGSSGLKYGFQLFTGNSRYAGVDRRYFIMSILPTWPTNDSTVSCEGRGNLEGWVQVLLRNKGIALAPGKTASVQVKSYFGPKYYDNLNQVGEGLENSIDFGFLAFLCQPMLRLMQFFYNVLANWGLANWGLCIILLTLLVKLITLPLTHRSMASMKKMQKLKPEMDRLKEKYGEDKESFQREMMNLYVKEGINPISGCLPMLIQMPVWMALYYTLFYSVELYQAPFIGGWIDDLSSKDPFYILPVSLGIAMFVQQRMTPQTLDNAQAKILLYGMPIFFTFIMLFLPAGLTLYIFVNTILGLLHHWYIHTQPDKPNDKTPKKKKAGWMERMQKHVEDQRRQQG